MPWVQSAGPSTEDSGTFDKDPAPVDDHMIHAKPGNAVTRAGLHGLHEPGPAMRRPPCAHRKPGGIGSVAYGFGKAVDLHDALAR